MIGPPVSGVFLWVIGILNLALLGILKVFREMRHGSYDEAAHRIPSARRAPVVKLGWGSQRCALRHQRLPLPQPAETFRIASVCRSTSEVAALALACGAQGDSSRSWPTPVSDSASSSACVSKTSISGPSASASDAPSPRSAASSPKAIQRPRQAGGPSPPRARDADSLPEDRRRGFPARPRSPHPTGPFSASRNWKRSTRWRSVIGEIGRPTLRVHDLRHTYASLARRAGADLRLLQKTMGHASITVTAHIYADLYDDELDDIASALDALDGTRKDLP
jgi:hypothetical protein